MAAERGLERSEARVAAARRRVAGAPDDRSASARLASALIDLSDDLRLAGECGRARVAAVEALELHRALLAASPTDRRMGAVAAALAQLVMIERALGDLERSSEHAREAVHLRRRLWKRARRDAESTRFLATALDRQARTFHAMRQPHERIAAYRERADLLRGLSAAAGAADGDDRDDRDDDLAAALCDLADAYEGAGRHDEAMAAAEESVPLRRRLLAAAPSDPDAWNGLARTLALVRDARDATGDREGALAAAREVVECGRRRIAFPGGEGTFGRDLAVDLDELGDLLAESGDRDGAAAAYSEAETRFRALQAAAPDDWRTRHDVSIVLSRRARLLLDSGDAAAAAPLWTESVALRRALVAAEPDRPERRRWLAGGLHDTGEVCEALGDHDGAAAAYEEAATLLLALHGEIDGLGVEIREWLTEAADAASACGRPDRAAELRAQAAQLVLAAGGA